MKKFSEAVLAKHKHMSHKANPHHAHSMGLEYTPSGKGVVRPIDTADAGYGGEAVSDAEGGEADAGKASKKAVSPMKMPTLVKKTNEETERERLMKLRSFVHQNRLKGMGKEKVDETVEQVDEAGYQVVGTTKDKETFRSKLHPKKAEALSTHYKMAKSRKYKDIKLVKVQEEVEQVDELKKSTLASYAKKAADEVSYHSFTAGTMSPKDPERLETDKKAMKRQRGVEKAVDKLAKEEVEQVDEGKLGKALAVGAMSLASMGAKAHTDTTKSVAQLAKERPAVSALLHKIGAHGQVPASDKRAAELQKKQDQEMPASERRSKELKKEEVELDEISQEARKNKMRTMGVNAAIQHPKKVEFAGGAIQMYRKALKNLSSKEMGGVAKKLPSVKEENDGTEADQGEYGYEGDMAMSQLKSIIRNAQSLHDHMEPQTDLPEWVQSKITLAADYIQTAADYWRSEKEEAMTEGKMKDIATSKAEAERILGGPVKPKASAVGGKGQPKNLRNLVSRLATKAMKAGHSVTEEEKKSGKVPRIGPMEKALEEEEVWDKPMPASKKQGSLSPEQKAKAKARAERAGRSYPNMVDNMWASKQ